MQLFNFTKNMHPPMPKKNKKQTWIELNIAQKIQFFSANL